MSKKSEYQWRIERVVYHPREDEDGCSITMFLVRPGKLAKTLHAKGSDLADAYDICIREVALLNARTLKEAVEEAQGSPPSSVEPSLGDEIPF